MAIIEDKYALALLRMQFQFESRDRKLEEVGVEIRGYDHSEIMEVILDSYGFPRDSTSTLKNEPESGQPIFCRDPLHDVYYDNVTKGTDKELRSVLEKWKEYAKDKSQFYWSEEMHN